MLRNIIDIASSSVDEVVVATTPSSQPIIDYCIKENISYFVGDEEDILLRLYATAIAYEADVIVRLWGDAPFVPAKQIVDAIHTFNHLGGYISITSRYGVVSVMPLELLEQTHRELTSMEDRHWIHKYMSQCKTIDTEEDLCGITS